MREFIGFNIICQAWDEIIHYEGRHQLDLHKLTRQAPIEYLVETMEKYWNRILEDRIKSMRSFRPYLVDARGHTNCDKSVAPSILPYPVKHSSPLDSFVPKLEVICFRKLQRMYFDKRPEMISQLPAPKFIIDRLLKSHVSGEFHPKPKSDIPFGPEVAFGSHAFHPDIL